MNIAVQERRQNPTESYKIIAKRNKVSNRRFKTESMTFTPPLDIVSPDTSLSSKNAS